MGEVGVDDAQDAAPTDRQLARVGVAAGWYDPENPRVWSGAPRALVDQLRRLGVYAGYRNAFVWPPAAKAARASLKARRRLNDGWALSAEMRTVATASQFVKRRRTPPDVDAWVQLAGGFGRIVDGRYVTVVEIPPSFIAGSEQWWRSFGYPGATRRGMAWVRESQLDVCRHAHAVCAVSRWTADSLVRDGIDAAKIHIVGYGRNVDIPAPADRDWSTPRFLFVGNDWGRKNGAAVVRAFTRVRAEVPAARLDVVSAHPPIGVDGVVEHGRLSKTGPFAAFDPEARGKFEELFAAATCFVVPSLVEPWGIVYVEAATAGLASIGTSIGGTTDSIGDGGIVVDPHDEEGLYRAMRRMADPDTARALGAVAEQRAKRLTWDAYGDRVVRALDLPQLASLPLEDFL